MDTHAHAVKNRCRSCVLGPWGAVVSAVILWLLISGCVSDSNGRRTRDSKNDPISLAERVEARNEEIASAPQGSTTNDPRGGLGESFNANRGSGSDRDSRGFNPLNYVYIGLAVLVIMWIIQVIKQVRRERRQHEEP